MTFAQLDEMLNKQSGLKGICGANDVREILNRMEQGDDRAQLAVEMFVHRVKKYLGRTWPCWAVPMRWYLRRELGRILRRFARWCARIFTVSVSLSIVTRTRHLVVEFARFKRQIAQSTSLSFPPTRS